MPECIIALRLFKNIRIRGELFIIVDNVIPIGETEHSVVFYNDIQQLLKSLTELQQDLMDEAESFPEGSLYCYNSKGRRNYCLRIPKGGNRKKERRIGIGKDLKMMQALVRKEYIKKALPLISGNIENCKRFLENYSCVDENSVMHSFVEKYPELASLIYDDRFDPEKWANEYSQDKGFFSDDLKSLSADGTEMRSLGELIIGGRLKHYGIPFRYEEAIDHPDISYVPDFTIVRPRDGKIIYWEHIGMVNDAGYMNRNKVKFNVYERYGIVPWENLIVSYSRANGGINEKLIDALIQGWLL